MKSHGFVNFIHHWQSNTSGLGLIKQFAIFFPPVQGRQRVKLTLDGPISADHCIRTAHQPDTHHTLK